MHTLIKWLSHLGFVQGLELEQDPKDHWTTALETEPQLLH